MKPKLPILILILTVLLAPVALAIGHCPWELLTLATLIGMAVATNQVTPRSGEGSRVRIPVGSGETLYGGTLAFYDVTGYGTATAGGNLFAGVVTENPLDNSTGQDGDVAGEVIIDGSVVLIGSGFTQADVGKQAFAVDNYTVSVSSTGNSYCGVITEVLAATKVRVMLDVGERAY